MANIRIRVGASLDRSTLAAFQPIVESAKRARKQVNDELARLTKAQQAEQRAQTKAADREARQRANAERDALREVEREVKRAAREKERAEQASARSAVKAAKDAAAERKRIEQQLLHETQRNELARQALRDRLIGGAGRGLYRGVAAAGRAAVGIAGSLARGAGVNLDLGSAAAANVDLETRAVQLSNQGYFPGRSGPAGVRQNPEDLANQARSLANRTGFSANDIMGAQQAFVAKTGDLEASGRIMGHIGMLAKATGADVTEMADAAGDVSNALDQMGVTGEEKFKRINDIMSAVTAQGKEGAVEIKDFASQMAKVASAAGQFEGGDKSITQFSALAQYTRAKGGSASATQAATSVMSFMNTFSKGARLDAFQKFGVKTTGAGGKIRDPEEIILDALQKTKGNQRQMGEMFMDVRARAITRPFETKFRESYAQATGTEEEKLAFATAETRKEFDRLKDATLGETELAESFKAAMDTSATKAQLFNNQVQETTQQLQNALYPALVDLTPMVVSGANALADLVTKLTGHDPREEQRKKDLQKGLVTAITSPTTGLIGSDTIQKNKDAEAALGQEAERLRKESEANPFAKRTTGERATTAILDAALNPLGALTGSKGALTEAADRKAKLEQSTKEMAAEDMRRKWDQIHNANKKVADAVDNGALRVVIVNQPSQAPTAKLAGTIPPGSAATQK